MNNSFKKEKGKIFLMNILMDKSKNNILFD